MTWKLERTKQCQKCPWKTSVDPQDIPNGYCETKHQSLEKTIADKEDPYSTLTGDLHIMACHESHEAHCVGWLNNQLGAGNNIGLRIKMMDCDNVHLLKLDGQQHPTFADTLPE